MRGLVRRVGFRLLLAWQFKGKRWLSERDAIAGRLPWRAWCRLCAWDAGAVAREIGRRAGGPLTFVQIGSNDGVTNDPLHDTVRRQRWTGTVVEPVPAAFERLARAYDGVTGVRQLQLAVGPEDGLVTMYTVDVRPGDPEWAGQIASLDRDHLLRHEYAMPDLAHRIVAVEVEAVRLATLMARTGCTSLDLLHVDAEGLDAAIIEQIPAGAAWAPRYVLFEAKHMAQAEFAVTRRRLEGLGYRVVNIWPDALAYREA